MVGLDPQSHDSLTGAVPWQFNKPLLDAQHFFDKFLKNSITYAQKRDRVL